MSFAVTTPTSGTITAGGTVLSWDSTAPTGDGPPEQNVRYVIDGLSASWAIEVLPPVAQPATITFRCYMTEADSMGTWLPFGIGDPISILANVEHPDLSTVNLWNFKGRVSDVSGVNHPMGGILFNVICVDRLADLTSTNAPPVMTLETIGESDLFLAYAQLAEDAGIDFDWQAGASTPDTDWSTLAPTIKDLENVTTYSALSTAILHDVRAGIARWLTQQIDTGTTDPESVARFRLEEWDPDDIDDLAGVVAFHWTGTEWTVIEDTAYAGTGMVLWADQLARDVGTWRQTRDQAVNTVELTYWTDLPDAPTAVTRREFSDLVDLYGRNTRSVPSWLSDFMVPEMGDYLLLSRDQVQTEGYGFGDLTVAYETLTEDQILTWADELFPIFGTQPLGRPFVVVGIPDRWRLAAGPIIMCRLMGVTMTLQEGYVRLVLSTRAVPPSAADGVTIDDVSAFPGPLMTFDDVDPALTIDSMALVGHTSI